MGKFKKGLFFGALVGAASMWMGTTKKGKEVREQIIDLAADSYVKLKKELLASKKLKDLTRHEYVKQVDAFVTKYAKQHKMQADVANKVKKVLASQFRKMKSDLARK